MLVIFTACQKEDQYSPNLGVFSGHGIINYENGMVSTMSTSRKFIDGKNETTVTWADASINPDLPAAQGTIYVEDNKYVINGITMYGDTYCYDAHIQTQLVFKGNGYMLGDTLYENGDVITTTTHTKSDTSWTTTWAGKWEAKSVKLNY